MDQRGICVRLVIHSSVAISRSILADSLLFTPYSSLEFVMLAIQIGRDMLLVLGEPLYAELGYAKPHLFAQRFCAFHAALGARKHPVAIAAEFLRVTSLAFGFVVEFFASRRIRFRE